ncbi:MAG: ADOP family duplicated permease [Candidatus Acidiferrales bacterium]
MNFLNELKIAVRSLSRVPALWLTVALTLALGIGANAAIFSVVRGVLLRPLANRDEDRLLYIRQSAPGYGEENSNFSVPEIIDLGRDLHTITELGTFSQVDFTVIGLGEPREIRAGVVDGTYFDVMGLKPVLGRLLGPSDDGPNAQGAVVLTYAFWRNALHSDPNVLGKTVQLGSFEGNRSGTIVGVVEPSVPYPMETEFFANVVTSPHHLSATMVQGRTHRMTEVFARLAPAATLEQARAEVRQVYGAMTSAHPETYKTDAHYRVDVSLMHDQINEKAKTILWVLFAAAGLLFVIACSNVANLILARTVRRESELAVRSALGATPLALRRSLLAESLVLCVSGAIAGLLIAWPMVAILARYASRYSVRAQGLTLDSSLVWIGIALAMISALFLAFVPRLPTGDASQGTALTSSGVRVTGGSTRRLRLFAVTQITASFLLLAGAGALMKTLLTLEQTQAPYDTKNVLVFNLPVMNYGRTPLQVAQFYRDARAQVAALPSVEHVATSFSAPWRDGQELGIALQFAMEGQTPQNGADYPRGDFRTVSPGYFETLGMPILAGRDFRETDRDGSELVVIVSESLAKRLLNGEEAVDRHISWTDPVIKFIGLSDKPRRIVGVVPDLDDVHIIPQPKMTIYQPANQEGWYGDRMLVKTAGDPHQMIATITKTIRSVSADQPIEKPATLGDIRSEILTPDKLNAIVFGGFAAVALLISIVGVAGVLAFSVSGRIREFGIRMALGAQPSSILKNVLLEGAIIGALGVAAGVVAGFALAGVIGKYVAEFKIPGMMPLIASALLILVAAIIAAALPAARAARVDAVEALRAE